ncbi:MAG: radical SAM protein, partial [Thermovirgaceae bacterium]|nr:radical SAM protein [Thermovirgaceae bacterium]
IRFTGGEPLVRKGFFQFLEDLKKAVPNIRTVLTTNGSLLRSHFDAIAASPLSGVNVSLDTLDPDLFHFITRNGSLEEVTSGIKMLSGATKMPIKINTVLMKGINDEEVPALIDFAHQHGAQLRLIEFMPLDASVWKDDLFVPVSDIFSKLPKPCRWVRQDNSGDHSAGPAKYYKNSLTGQRLGIIEAVSHHFCESCNRLRISATGILRPCLFSNEGIDLRPALLSGNSEEIKLLILQGALKKPRSLEGSQAGTTHMSRVGG